MYLCRDPALMTPMTGIAGRRAALPAPLDTVGETQGGARQRVKAQCGPAARVRYRRDKALPTDAGGPLYCALFPGDRALAAARARGIECREPVSSRDKVAQQALRGPCAEVACDGGAVARRRHAA